MSEFEFNLNISERFQKAYFILDQGSQGVIDIALILLAENPRHPSLRTHRVKATKSVWESSTNMDLRITWQYDGPGVIALRNCGHHDRTLKNP